MESCAAFSFLFIYKTDATTFPRKSKNIDDFPILPQAIISICQLVEAMDHPILFTMVSKKSDVDLRTLLYSSTY
jgi:hypothetical protein